MLPRELVDMIFYEVHKLNMKDVLKQMIGLIEFWRDVILNGEKTKAQVSSFGRFRNVYGVVCKPLPTKSGYVYVKVNKKRYNIHRLIAIAFELPKEEGQDTVDHIDGKPTNNHIHNLRWTTHKPIRPYIRHIFGFHEISHFS